MDYSAEIKLSIKEIYTMWNNIKGININKQNNIVYKSKYINISMSYTNLYVNNVF